MLDLGSAVSLTHQDTLSQLNSTYTKLEIPALRLVTAPGDPLLIKAHLLLSLVIGEKSMLRSFMVVNSLVVPVILGVDFLQTHDVLLDFLTISVKFSITNVPDVFSNQELSTVAIYKGEQTEKIKQYPIAALQDVTDVVDECAIPWFNKEDVIELPYYTKPNLQQLLKQYQQLFRYSPGKTSLYIPT